MWGRTDVRAGQMGKGGEVWEKLTGAGMNRSRVWETRTPTGAAGRCGAVVARRRRRRSRGRVLHQGGNDMLHVRLRQGTTMRQAAVLQRLRKDLELSTVIEEGPEPREEAHLAKGPPDVLQQGGRRDGGTGHRRVLLSAGGRGRGQALPIVQSTGGGLRVSRQRPAPSDPPDSTASAKARGEVPRLLLLLPLLSLPQLPPPTPPPPQGRGAGTTRSGGGQTSARGNWARAGG